MRVDECGYEVRGASAEALPVTTTLSDRSCCSPTTSARPRPRPRESLTLLAAAIRSDKRPLADALISERLVVKDASPYNRRQLARIQAGLADRQLAVTTA